MAGGTDKHMALMDRVQKDMVEAMKAKDEVKLGTVRMIKSALMKYKADAMKEADEAGEAQILNQLLKQRREAAEMFRKGGRTEMAEKEEQEAKLIESYMPALATAEDMDAAIAAAIAETGVTSLKQMGRVMNAAREKLAGKRVDGKDLSDRVRSKLS